MATSEQNSQAIDHDSLCMQNEVGISALTKIPGFWCAADTTSKLCSTCVVLALMASCQDWQQQTLLVFLSSFQIQ